MTPFLQGLRWNTSAEQNRNKICALTQTCGRELSKWKPAPSHLHNMQMKSNEKGILTDIALLSGTAVPNSMWYLDIISCNVILQFKCFFSLLLKKTRVNKCQASITDSGDKISQTGSFSQNGWVYFGTRVSTLYAVGCGAGSPQHWLKPQLHLFWRLLLQPWC